MQPFFGFVLYLIVSAAVSSLAKKRGSSFWLYFVLNIILGLILARVTAQISGSGLSAGLIAFMAPLLIFLQILSSRDSRQIAVDEGLHGAFIKCKYCAEPIRKEAVKCRYCGSDVSACE